jgi:hypothetical protein
VSTPAGYRRSSFRIPGAGDLANEAAQDLIGNELNVRMHDVELANGTITDCRVIDGGANLWVTIEYGGRACAACRNVYTEDEAPAELVTAGTFREEAGRQFATWALVYRDLPSWAPVCREWATCERIRMDGDPTDAEPVDHRAGWPTGVCKHCAFAITYDGMLWRHTTTELIACADNVKNASPGE